MVSFLSYMFVFLKSLDAHFHCHDFYFLFTIIDVKRRQQLAFSPNGCKALMSYVTFTFMH